MRGDLFTHLQKLPLRFFDNHPVGELMSRLVNDIDAVNQVVSQNVLALLTSVLLLVGIIITMFVLNHWLAMATLLVVPLMLWFTGFIAKYTRRGFRELQKHLGGMNSVMEEAISGAKVISAFGRKEAVLAAFREHNRRIYKASLFANTYALMLMPLTSVLGNFFVVVLAGLGGWLALKGLASVGTIAAFISYGHLYIGPLRQLANIYNSVQAALAGSERVFEIIDQPCEKDIAPASATAPLQGEVQFREVDFGYDPGVPVIKKMSINARAGETIALVGPTGAGKTTLVNLLAHFYELGDGAIEIDGRDLRTIPKTELRRQLGIVLQDTYLFSASVMENIRYGRLDADDEECIRAARMAAADHFIRQLPQGYQTMLSERAGNLSQGQRQMLAIARAVLSDPAILILDEATSSVDTRTEAHIQNALLRLMRGRTSFVIAHRLSTIRDADHVLVIKDGRITEQGNHPQLLRRRGLYYQLYMTQFQHKAV